MSTLLEPEQIAALGTQVPRILLPHRDTVFADRAHRFDELAAGHRLGDWLGLLARISRAQHELLQQFPTVPLPGEEALRLAREHGMPLLPARHWPRHPAWRQTLQLLVEDTLGRVPVALRGPLGRLLASPGEKLEGLADRVLRAELTGDGAATLPFVAAALQVYWTHMATSLEAAAIAAIDLPGVCPCCGSLPVASVVRMDAGAGSLRYLHCSLCNIEWNLVRIKCTACASTAGIGYRLIEGGSAAVRAETCDSCHSYLKILYQDKDPLVDPVADDLATLVLDMLVDEAGYSRSGPNLLFVPGNA